MLSRQNDRWSASFTPVKPGRYVYAIEAWTDDFATWRRDLIAKQKAGMDVALEIAEGQNILMSLKSRNAAQARLIREACRASAGTADTTALLSDELAAAASKGTQCDLSRSPGFPVLVDRPIARAGAWYEMRTASIGCPTWPRWVSTSFI
jgi:starch synthase (maltosyl-transferring)